MTLWRIVESTGWLSYATVCRKCRGLRGWHTKSAAERAIADESRIGAVAETYAAGDDGSCACAE